MPDQEITNETYIRTVVKAACYRVMSMVFTFILTLILGGNVMQAFTMSGIILVVGSLHYYLYDRIWLWIRWNRDQQGKDTVKRSIVKSIIYRLTALIITAALAKVVFADTTLIAFMLATLKFFANAAGYFIIERIFNCINWGRK